MKFGPLPEIRLNPLTIKKIRRFRSIKRGYYSFLLILAMVFASLFAEVLINKRALVVNYEGKYFFPIYGDMIPGTVFGLDYEYETNYRQLGDKLSLENNGWVIMPPVPYDAYENDFREDGYPPFPPSWENRHFLGTDTSGRDVLARLVYGFRIAFFFSVVLLAVNYAIGVSIGSAMGFFGGEFDLFFQRIIEIWTNVPFLYVIIFISSIVVPNFLILVLIMALFGWMGMTWVMRTMTYREKARDYVLAARALGATNSRIIFRHIIPNTVSVIVTYAPFSISNGIIMLTSLDYMGFGLPPPTPSWGELLSQGWANMESWWMAASVITAMILTLTAVTFVGEAVR